MLSALKLNLEHLSKPRAASERSASKASGDSKASEKTAVLETKASPERLIVREASPNDPTDPKWKADPRWTRFRAFLDDRMVGAFSSFDQGHGDAFLNGLRTDAGARRKGVATALIKGIDADLAARGYKSIRFATTSHNEPMIALTEKKLGLKFRPHKMCRCGARSERPMRATRLQPSAEELPAVVAALWEFVQASDFYQLSGGIMHSRTIQFAACAPPTIEALVKAGAAYILGPLSAPTAAALVTPSETGPNSILSFAAGPDVGELLDDLRALIPAGGELWAYWPVGSAAYELAITQTRLPSGARFYCPRDTEQLVTEWEAGSLAGGA